MPLPNLYSKLINNSLFVTRKQQLKSGLWAGSYKFWEKFTKLKIVVNY
jgi:hypothetical protein